MPNKISNVEWMNHFQKVFNDGTKDNVTPEIDEDDEDIFDAILDSEISIAEIKNAIRHLKRGKAAGPDLILAELLKLSENEVNVI